ncbi:MAG: hypothetical protein IJU45_03940, partial [Clostridia bacterium]|nr:hypothetical protein [Clostridia bacterium]
VFGLLACVIVFKVYGGVLDKLNEKCKYKLFPAEGEEEPAEQADIDEELTEAGEEIKEEAAEEAEDAAEEIAEEATEEIAEETVKETTE